MERRTLEENRENKRDYAVLVGLRSPVLREDNADEESLAELAALVETAGGQAVGTILQSREKPDPHSFIGEAKVEDVAYQESIDVTAVCPPKVLGQLKDYIEGWTEPKEDWE